MVDHETAGTITSSPLFNFLFLVKKREAIPSKFADDPELTITVYLAPIYLEKHRFKFLNIFSIE